MCAASPHGATRLPPQINASTQPAEGAGGSRSKAGELPLGLLSGEERTVDTGLLWELACQPTNLLQVYPVHCGSWPASDGGLTANQSLAGAHRTLWERACSRWRPVNRPISCRCTPSPVGAGLPAMAPCQPTILFLLPIDRSLRSAWECSQGRSAFHFCVERCVRNTALSHAFFRLPGRKPCL
jgi:hypothetical protein